MTKISRAICIGVLSAGAAGALGFGAVQAFAAPAAATLSCSDERCDAICVSRGYAYGDCSTGACRCFQ